MLGAAALGLSACLPWHSLFSLYVNHTRSSKEDLWPARPSWPVEFRLHLSYFLSSILLSFIKTLHLFFCPWLLSHHPLLVSVPFSWLTLPGLFCHGLQPLCLAIKGRSSPRPLLPVDSPLGSVSVHSVWTTLWNTWLSIQLSSWHLCLHSTCAWHGSISAHTHSLSLWVSSLTSPYQEGAPPATWVRNQTSSSRLHCLSQLSPRPLHSSS